jgi:hypothetical protein
MYQHTESLRGFKRQQAREELARMARAPADPPPELDLVSGHFAFAKRAAWLRRLAGFAVLLAVCASLAWFIFSSGGAGYASLTRWPACVFPTATGGCFTPQPAAP